MNDTLTYREFEASVSYDARDDLFVGRILGVDDILTFHGESTAELRERFASTVDGYLEHCATISKRPQRAYSGKIVLRMKPELHRRAATAAGAAGVSLNAWLVAAAETVTEHFQLDEQQVQGEHARR